MFTGFGFCDLSAEESRLWSSPESGFHQTPQQRRNDTCSDMPPPPVLCATPPHPFQRTTFLAGLERLASVSRTAGLVHFTACDPRWLRRSTAFAELSCMKAESGGGGVTARICHADGLSNGKKEHLLTGYQCLLAVSVWRLTLNKLPVCLCSLQPPPCASNADEETLHH